MAVTFQFETIQRHDDVQVDLETGKATVTTTAKPEVLMSAVQRTGYETRLWENRSDLVASKPGTAGRLCSARRYLGLIHICDPFWGHGICWA